MVIKKKIPKRPKPIVDIGLIPKKPKANLTNIGYGSNFIFIWVSSVLVITAIVILVYYQ